MSGAHNSYYVFRPIQASSIVIVEHVAHHTLEKLLIHNT